ncbi:serine hydrolase domain-containing protein [Parapedobacter lycopersici]|uniref:serine hydrolase domain-containing protein n=1 Tax=Parapedobacter lycopersici TaxID=1864939 RepID=UPI00333F86D2
MMIRHLLFLAVTLGLLLPSAAAQSLPEQLDAVMRQHYPSDRVPGGVLVVKQGDEPVFSRGFGSADPKTGAAIKADTHFRMASVSKQFTAMAVYLLAEAGKLTLDDPLAQFFEGLADTVGAITIRQLLNHTSGIWDYEALIPDSQTVQVLDADVLRLIRRQEHTYFAPGTRFRYSNTGYCLLSLIVAKVSGQRYADFVKQRIFLPLGMDEALVYEPQVEIANRAYGYHPDGDRFVFADQSLTSAAQGDGGVYLSAQEYLRWAEALLVGGFPSSAYRDSLEAEKSPVNGNVYYSMGWFIGREKDGTACLFHSGESTGFHNIVYLNPHRGLTVALFTNRDDMEIAGIFERVAQLIGINPQVAATGESVSLFRWLNEVY